MRQQTWALVIVAALVSGQAEAAMAAAKSVETSSAVPRSTQKRVAEDARSQLQQKLTALKRIIGSTEKEKTRAADALEKSESAISNANRALLELNGEQIATQTQLSVLTAQLDAQKTLLTARQAQLGNLLRQQYLTNKEEPIPLLLSGEDPARIGRSLRYLDYVAQAQARLLATIQADLQSIEKDRAQLQIASGDLDDIATESRAEKARLEKQQLERSQLMTKLASQLSSQRAEASMMERDENRLGGLVEQLGKLILRQQKAEALAAQRRQQQAARQAAAARAKELAATRLQQAQQKQQQQRQAANAKIELRRADVSLRASATETSASATSANRVAAGDAIDNDLSNDETKKSASKATLSAPTSSAFASLKGQLHMPVKGELVNRFGTRRADGPNWKGLFITAPEGTSVHAVAAGQVVFADWLRGFGNLIILDHGGQYLSIYGNNQTMLKHPGDRIGAGDVIANAGNTGGNAQSGLYFEMRYQGRALDPLGWITSR